MNRIIFHERLPMFLLLSVVVHFLLLAVYGSPVSEVTRRFLGQPVLQVQMQGMLGESHASPVPKQAPVPEIPKMVSPDRDSSARTVQRVNARSSTDMYADENQDQPAPVTEGYTETGIRNHLLGQLQTRLSRHLVYPPLARSRGWEGTVLLGLRVKSNGHLEKIHIEHSSGYAVLDNSALNSLMRLGQLAEASAWLNGHGLDMELPVIYRLIDN